MSSKFYGLWNSEVWKLVPESQQKCFLVHGDLLASLSEPLKTLITCTKPKDDRRINIGAWDTETLGRLVEYIYTGDYHCPDPVSLTPISSPDGESRGEEFPEVVIVPALSVQTQEVASKELRSERPLTPLPECFSTGLDLPAELSAATQSANFDPIEHDFEEVFLTHAKIYALALNLEIEALCALAIRRLLRTLVDIGSVKPDSFVKVSFVELARYTYSSTSNSEDPLRRIVSQFAALNFTALQSQKLRELIREGGDFASDLMEKASRRLSVTEKDVEMLKLEMEELEVMGAGTEKEAAAFRVEKAQLSDKSEDKDIQEKEWKSEIGDLREEMEAFRRLSVTKKDVEMLKLEVEELKLKVMEAGIEKEAATFRAEKAQLSGKSEDEDIQEKEWKSEISNLRKEMEAFKRAFEIALMKRKGKSSKDSFAEVLRASLKRETIFSPVFDRL